MTSTIGWMAQSAANQEGWTKMSNLKRWRQIGQGNFHKWEALGDELEGAWQGTHEGRFGPLGTLETESGLVTFPLHAASLARLSSVRVGTELRIRYTGPQTSKAGRLFKGFEVFVFSNDDVIAFDNQSGQDATPREA
jgi:hypothetical protein